MTREQDQAFVRGIRIFECRETDCARPIRFVRIEATGRLMPVDPMPHAGGNVMVLKVGKRFAGYVLSKDHPVKDGYRRFMPHHATCVAKKAKPTKAPATPRAEQRVDEPLF